jgi:predicted component of type VI protein secretion system
MLPLVIQIERTDEHTADTCAFAQSPVRLGRNALNDLELDESFVSQWHGVIRFDDKQVTYLDLGSTNPTLVDGQPIARNVEVPITEQTDLRIGTLRLHLLRVEAPPELFGARRRTAFARAGTSDLGSVASTMYLGDVTPPPLQGSGRAAAVAAASAAAAAATGQTPALADVIAHGLARPIVTPSMTPQPMLSQPAAVTPSMRPAQRPSFGPRPSDQTLDPTLHGSYQQYRHAWTGLFAHLKQQLEQAQGQERAALFDHLVHEFPEISREADLRELSSKLGLSPLRTGVPEMEDWLKRLTDGLFPPTGVAINVALAMERIGEVLEVFSTAFVELRKANAQFCEEMALEKPPEDSLLQTTENPRALLAYLLNPGKEGSVKVTELSRALADFAVHQVALVSAVVQGARDMLDDLSPEGLSKGKSAPPPGGFLSKVFASDKARLWDYYISRFGEVIDEDRFTRKLFGRGFARKYYAITGGRRSLPTPEPRT